MTMTYNNCIINDKFLKKYSPIPLNYNTDEVANYAAITEQIWVRPILGITFYEELLDQVKNNNVSEANATLLTEALWPYEAFAVAYEALPFIWAHVSEVGLTLGKSDNSDSLALKDITYIQSHLRKQVEARKDFLIKWLEQHAESFPLWVYDECSCGCSSLGGDCCSTGKLNNPNPLNIVYTPPRRDTSIR